MEIFVLGVFGIIALSCLTANLLIAYMIWKHVHDKKEKTVQMVAPEETPEEKEARRAAAEVQRLYDQAFIDMMNYNGRPTKKERGIE